ncbi:MAG: ATP-dependent helicase [Ruminococcaceae bacterium]|nr:ATP-dependent helicase [Oscillospiraceae bacterium]
MEGSLPLFDPNQQAAIADDASRIYLAAVPGSGKTTVLCGRIARLLGQGVPPSAILALTFSRNSAADMAARFRRMYGEGLEPPAFRTLHSFSYRLIANRQVSPNMDSAALSRIAGDAFSQAKGYPPSPDELEQFLSLISYCQNTGIAPSRAEKEKIFPDFALAFRVYQEGKETAGLFDYDDLLLTAEALLRERPITGISAILVDEAQDLSPLQHRIIQLLARNASLFMVGDEDQSIYSFRGADASPLVQFPQSYGGKLLYLDTNYRSTQKICRAADRLIRSNVIRTPKQIATPNPKGPSLRLYRTNCRTSLYRHLVQAVSSSGERVAVLFKTNAAIFPLAFFLTRAGIPYSAPSDLNQFLRYGDISLLVESLAYCAGIKPLSSRISRHLAPSLQKEDPSLVEKTARKIGELSPEAALTAIRRELLLYSLPVNRFRWRNLRAMAGECSSVEEFLSTLEQATHLAEGANLTLSTVHQAKGCEYQRVYLCDWEEGKLDPPSANRPFEGEEETRLLYVALTRAAKSFEVLLCNPTKVSRPLRSAPLLRLIRSSGHPLFRKY